METQTTTTNNTGFKQKEAEKYNQEILELPEDRSTKIKLIGKRILVRPFKLVEKTDSGLYIPNKQNYKDDETNRLKVEDMELPFHFWGVVCNISEDCSEEFKNKVDVGDIVHLSPSHWNQFQVNKEHLTSEDKYFTVDVAEGKVIGIEKQ